MNLIPLRIRRSVPLFLRAAYFSTLRNAEDRKNRVLFALSKGNSEEYPALLFSHRAHLYRDYPEPWFSLQRNKVDNLKLACRKTDGTVLEKGETFSFWKTTGPASPLRGYRRGMTIINGGIKAAVGGGLCQLSNALYWTALHCGCIITERHRHSLDLFPDSKRTVPFGCGATVFFNYRDLRFIQNIFDGIFFRTYLDDEFLHVEAYTRKKCEYRWIIEERNHRFEREGGNVTRKNEIYRLTVRPEDLSPDFLWGRTDKNGNIRRPKAVPRSKIILEEKAAENCGRVLYDVDSSLISEKKEETLSDILLS